MSKRELHCYLAFAAFVAALHFVGGIDADRSLFWIVIDMYATVFWFGISIWSFVRAVRGGA